MDAERGRQQTTKGVWLSKSPKLPDPTTLVLDLEGSDGRERGEDDTNFERQSALFALAVADVLLVNVWCHDIGREQGSGKPLMKTIFQARGWAGAAAALLQLMLSCLLSVSRDCRQFTALQHDSIERSLVVVLAVQPRFHSTRGNRVATSIQQVATIVPHSHYSPQVNLKLFAPEPGRHKTTLLFVIRDKSRTPLAKLTETLGSDVLRMWDSISKPPQYKCAQLKSTVQ